MRLEGWREKVAAQQAVLQLPNGIRDEQDLLATGELFAEMAESRPWQRLMQLAGDLRVLHALAGHADLDARPGYYHGLLNGMSILLESCGTVVLRAAELVEQRKEAEAIQMRENMKEASKEEQ